MYYRLLLYTKKETLNLPKIGANGIEVNYVVAGTGFPVALVHGLSDDLNLWAPLIPELSRRYQTVAMDIRGHGHSGKPKAPYTIQQFSKDLFVFLEKIGIPKIHLLGFSLGGAIAQQFTLSYPGKVKSLILLSTFSYADIELRKTFQNLKHSIVTGGYEAFFDEAVKLVVTPKFASANARAIAEMKEAGGKTNSPAAVANAITACLNFNVKDMISQISLPTLIVAGRKDVLTPLHFSKQIQQSIKGSQLEIMENVGHNLLVPEKKDKLSKMILEFLSSQ